MNGDTQTVDLCDLRVQPSNDPPANPPAGADEPAWATFQLYYTVEWDTSEFAWTDTTGAD